MMLKKLKENWNNPLRGLLIAIAGLFLFAIFLLVLRFIITGSLEYWYLIWNLFLATIPVTFGYILFKNNKKGITWSKLNFLLLGLWVIFLPNAFYLLSDFIHLPESNENMLVYDVVLFAVYSLLGFLLGYISLAMIHVRFGQRSNRLAMAVIFGTLFLCGYAIYLGRYLRWNSWDVITNPFGIIFDVSNSFLNVHEYPHSIGVTILFFTFFSIFYLLLWKAFVFARSSHIAKVLK